MKTTSRPGSPPASTRIRWQHYSQPWPNPSLVLPVPRRVHWGSPCSSLVSSSPRGSCSWLIASPLPAPRATTWCMPHMVSWNGAWYFEVKVMHLGSTRHTHLEWATNMVDIDMPIGCCTYGFGYRDTDGAKVHMSWRDNYGDDGYGTRDVLGLYISLANDKYETQAIMWIWIRASLFLCKGRTH
jgi:hypothetical protein